MFRPIRRVGLGGLLLALAICCTVRAQVPDDLPPPTKLSHIIDDLQGELDRIEAKAQQQRAKGRLAEGEQEYVDRAARKVVELLKILLAKKDEELLELYDNEELRDRLADFADVEERRPHAFEDAQKRAAEKRKGTIRAR